LNRVLNIALVGAGAWGQNLLRSFSLCSRCHLAVVCDIDEAVRQKVARRHAAARVTDDYRSILDDPSIEAVAIATPAAQHHAHAMQALAAGKHVLVEKPLALNAADARAVADQARRAGKHLMVGHLLRYHPAVDAVGRLLARGELGRVYYMYTQRTNLGVVRRDENAWWSLAPHDVSVVCGLFGASPISVSATGMCYLQSAVEDVVVATLQFADGKMAHVHVSWLDPHKTRRMTLVGDKKMVVFDDMSANEKIRICDKGADPLPPLNSFADVVSLRTGDIIIPKIAGGEPLVLECQHFVDAVLDDAPVRTDGAEGLRVVQVLQAGSISLQRRGAAVELAEVES